MQKQLKSVKNSFGHPGESRFFVNILIEPLRTRWATREGAGRPSVDGGKNTEQPPRPRETRNCWGVYGAVLVLFWCCARCRRRGMQNRKIEPLKSIQNESSTNVRSKVRAGSSQICDTFISEWWVQLLDQPRWDRGRNHGEIGKLNLWNRFKSE